MPLDLLESELFAQLVIASHGETTLRDSEHPLILKTPEAVGWVVGGPKGAAAKLGLKRTALIHKMKKLAIYRPYLQSNLDGIGPAPQETN
jgi:transcriptional regulator of acetoin/glycerol metabolism